MEFLPNGITLEIAPGTFPLSTDSMALAHFVRLPRNARVLDLGSGCGTLGLLLCAGNESCHVTGLELDPVAHETALENIHRNGLTSRMESICTDLRHISGSFGSGQFSVCISNPPYFSGGPASQTLPDARRENTCTLAQLLQSAGYVLKYGGDCYLVHRPERLAEMIALGAENGMEAKRLLLLRHRESGPISLVLLQLRKGGKPGLKIEEAALFDDSGDPTEYYKGVYHLA
ncbi:MAG: methyltransferase [Oscillospiraceae bacterium]|nr:methyltransferase [Oscillospiraceae bacterium]MBQ7129660.1 methyltransferase [Oscillospiraceae bacterium]